MAFIYARVQKTEKDFPLWAVQLRQNWNLDDTPKQEGDFQTIRLFYTETAALTFTLYLNLFLQVLEDVPK